MIQPRMHEETHFWRDVTLDNLELLRARYITHTFSPHIHEGYAIGVIEAGAETFRYRHARHVAPSGSVVVINPGEVHTGEALTDAGWRYRMLYPSAALLRHMATMLAARAQDYPFFAAPVINDPVLAQKIIQAHQSLEQENSALAREAHLWQMLGHLIQRHADNRHVDYTHVDNTHGAPMQTRPHEQSIRKAQEYLDAHFVHNVRLDQLATLVHLSSYHFLRVFKATVGLSPHAYQTQLRIRRAKELLTEGVALADVAQQVGFVDQSHLNRHFKRVVGIPPGQYKGGNRHSAQYCTRRAISP